MERITSDLVAFKSFFTDLKSLSLDEDEYSVANKVQIYANSPMGILLRTGFLQLNSMSFEDMVKLYTDTKSKCFTRSASVRANLDDIVEKLHGNV